MKLHELNESIDKKQIDQWITENVSSHEQGIMFYNITKDKVNFTTSISVDSHKRLKRLDIKFGTIDGDFVLNNPYLDSFDGLPDVISGDFTVQDISAVRNIPGFTDKDFKYLPKRMKSMMINTIDMNSWHNIHKFVDYLEDITFKEHCKSNVLGFMLIPGFKTYSYFGTLDHKVRDVVKILNKHVGKGKAGLLAAQQELIDNNFDDYADT